ncbi:hypothetical protein [Aureibacillus halotolerans]|uniref:hypothetical protein n=1 Tax=Aureibacillus halotolerans TaxID=1508390 RepID=UPI0014152737|nr:hypothetical protein [Aureibacillus halotolerans]
MRRATTKANVPRKPTPGALKTLVFRGAKPSEERSCLTGNEHPNEAKQRRKRAFLKSL